MKNTLALAASGAAAGFLFCFYALPNYKILFVAAATCLGVASLLVSLTKSKRRAEASMAAVVFAFAALSGIYNILFTHTHIDKIKEFSGKRVEACGTVVESSGEGYCYITLSGKLCGVSSRMSFYSLDPIEYGSKVTISAIVRDITDVDDMLYSYPSRKYASLEDVYIINVSEPEGFSCFIAKIRTYSQKVSQRLVSVGGNKYGGILAAMLCGNTSYVSKEVRTGMTRAGIGHILAVSGLHVSVISGFIALVLKRFGRTLSFVCSESVMILFVIFSGAKISSIRALIMMSVLLISDLLLVEYSGKESIAFCMLLMSVSNPYIVGSPSFILSITGVFGAGTAARAVITGFRIKSRILKGLAVSACAAVCTLPATVCFFGEESFISVISNYLLVPLCSAALCISMIFAALGCVPLLDFLVKIASVLTAAAVKASEIISSQKFTWISVNGRWVAAIVILLGILVLFMYLLTGNIKTTAKASAAAYICAAVIMLFAARIEYNQTTLSVKTNNGSFVCTLTKSGETALIFSDEDYADVYTDAMNNESLSAVSFIIILDSRENGSTVIKEVNRNSLFQVQKLENGSGAAVSAFGINITATPEAAEIMHGGGRVFIASRQKSASADISISVFDGVSVINSVDGVRIIEDELECEYRLKELAQ